MTFTILSIVATSVGAFALLSRALETPFQASVQTLAALDQLDKALGARRTLFDSRRAEDIASARQSFDDIAANAHAAVGLLETVERNVGAAIDFDDESLAAISDRVNKLFDLSRDAIAQGGRRTTPVMLLDEELSRIVERLRARTAMSAADAATLAGTLRTSLLTALGFELAIAAVVSYLVLRYLDKWIVRPVNQFRIATERIGAGDFTHRVPVQGKDEVAVLGVEVNRMAGLVLVMQEERARDARATALGELSRAIAHNIRNPLAGIRGLAEATRAELDGDQVLTEFQSRIIDTVDRFDGWMKEMLRASKPGAEDVHEIDVKTWMHDVVSARRSAADAVGLQMQIDTALAPGKAWFDKIGLEHAIEAILTNAVDVSPAGGVVQCVVTSSAKEGTWSIQIRDQGPGMDPEIRNRIFEHGFTTKADGSGVGLALALQIVQGHGGSITVAEANPGRRPPGAAFTIRLPVRPRFVREGRPGAPEEHAHNGAHARH